MMLVQWCVAVSLTESHSFIVCCSLINAVLNDYDSINIMNLIHCLGTGSALWDNAAILWYNTT